MRYISNVVGHDKIALVVDFTGVKVGDCTARGVLHKIYQKEVEKGLDHVSFGQWYDRIVKYNIIGIDDAYANATSIEHFYAFLDDYYSLLSDEGWFGKAIRKNEKEL